MIPQHKISANSELTQNLNAKAKKDKNSLHNLPKLDKSQLYFNTYHTQTPVALKITKVNNTEGSSNPKPYFMNNNLKRVSNKIKTSKDQNKSITNFLDITLSQNFIKENKVLLESNMKGKLEDKDLNLENKPNEIKVNKPHIKHKNSCGNSVTLEKNFIISNDKNFRPSLYESATSKNKEYFHQNYYNRKLQKPEEKKQEEQTNELEVILTEVSETNMNEFPNSETKQAILTLFPKDVLLGSGLHSNNAYKDFRGSVPRKDKESESEEGVCNFIVKNQDTGNIKL